MIERDKSDPTWKQLYHDSSLRMTVFFGDTQLSEAIPWMPIIWVLEFLTGSKMQRPRCLLKSTYGRTKLPEQGMRLLALIHCIPVDSATLPVVIFGPHESLH